MTHHLVPYNRVDVARVERTGFTALAFVVDHFLLLPVGVLVALAWANTAGESYFRSAHALRFSVNDIGMDFFVGAVSLATHAAAGRCRGWRCAGRDGGVSVVSAVGL